MRGLNVLTVCVITAPYTASECDAARLYFVRVAATAATTSKIAIEQFHATALHLATFAHAREIRPSNPAEDPAAHAKSTDERTAIRGSLVPLVAQRTLTVAEIETAETMHLSNAGLLMARGSAESLKGARQTLRPDPKLIDPFVVARHVLCLFWLSASWSVQMNAMVLFRFCCYHVDILLQGLDFFIRTQWIADGGWTGLEDRKTVEST
jgi:hypothetical protein